MIRLPVPLSPARRRHAKASVPHASDRRRLRTLDSLILIVHQQVLGHTPEPPGKPGGLSPENQRHADSSRSAASGFLMTLGPGPTHAVVREGGAPAWKE